MDKKQEFLKKMLATFRIEAEENINTISASLIELEKGCTDERQEEILEIMFRTAHSLKGASRAVNITDVEQLCHAFENIMSALRAEEISFSQQLFDLLNETLDLITEILEFNEETGNLDLNERITEHVDILATVELGLEPDIKARPAKKTAKPKNKESVQIINGQKEVVLEQIAQASLPEEKPRRESKTVNETIRVSSKKLDKLLVQAEEMLALKLSAIERTEKLSVASSKLSNWAEVASLVFEAAERVKQSLNKKAGELTETEEEMEKLIRFYDWTHSQIHDIESDMNALKNQSRQEEYSASSRIEGLLDDVKDLITVPFSLLLDGFPKMIRDIARDLDKKIDFVVEGDDIEVDRRILENLKSPFIHILRNAIDYGIERENVRIEKNKPKAGKINLKIEQLGNNSIEILITDDGAGLNLEKLRELYLANEGVDHRDVDKIDEYEYLNYIFKSGISTSDIITDLSGRGLGLAIVQETIEQLGGTIAVESEIGKSCAFRIVLPISIVTFRGVLFESSGRRFIVPTAKVEKVVRLSLNEVKTVENKSTISFEGKVIPLADLSDLLEISKSARRAERVQVIILSIKGESFGLIIDRVIGEQEVLVKNFNRHLTRVRNIAGATILGSGKVVPILSVSDLLQSLSKNNRLRVATSGNLTDEHTESSNSILVVEDSITSRTLLRNILEARGNQVTTAIDGEEGFRKLKEGNFDAVISDVEMPRMNGFELTAKIRSDREYSDIPVILVTSLSKREDREKGIDVGANAYIVKSSFDQNNLLEILDRLV